MNICISNAVSRTGAKSLYVQATRVILRVFIVKYYFFHTLCDHVFSSRLLQSALILLLFLYGDVHLFRIKPSLLR